MGTRFRTRLGWKQIAVALVALGATVVAPAASASSGHPANQSAGPHPFMITSPAFRDGGRLPVSAEFGGPGSAGSGCAGENLAPEVRWSNIPAQTRGFASTINDVDAPVAGGFHHWVVYNIPASVHELEGHGSNPFSEGTNSFGLIGYDGPCPPPDGQVHHYVFTVYALSVPQVSGVHITYEQLLQEIAPDVTGATSIIGTFHLPLH